MTLSLTDISELCAIHGSKSLEYQQGVESALVSHFYGKPIKCPFPAASAEMDAFFAGVEEGHVVWWQLKRRLSGKSINLAIFNIPEDLPSASTNKRKRSPSMPFFGGFRFADVRQMVIDLRHNGIPYTEIASQIKKRWPEDPQRHVTRSAIQRFWTKACKGMLKSYGIDLTVQHDKKGAR